MKINIPEVLVHLRQTRGRTREAERAAMRALAWLMRDRRRYAAALRAARAGAAPLRGWPAAGGDGGPAAAVAAVGVDRAPRRAAAARADVPGLVARLGPTAGVTGGPGPGIGQRRRRR